MTISPETLSEWRTAAKSAQAGPWIVDDDFIITTDPVERDMERRCVADTRYFHRPFADANAAFIALARTALPEALDEIERLTERCRELIVDDAEAVRCANNEAIRAEQAEAREAELRKALDHIATMDGTRNDLAVFARQALSRSISPDGEAG